MKLPRAPASKRKLRIARKLLTRAVKVSSRNSVETPTQLAPKHPRHATSSTLVLALLLSGAGCGADSTPPATVDQATSTTSPSIPPDLRDFPSAGSSGATARTATGTQPTAAGTRAPAATAAAGSSGGGASGQPNAAAGSSSPAAGGGGAGSGGTAGQAGAAMMAAAGSGATDPSLPPGATNFVAVCAGGKVGMDSDAAGRIPGLDGGSQEFSGVKLLVKAPNQVLDFKTTLVVPKTPTVQNVLFIWPGLQNRGGKDPGRIGNGVLQPVLTWGPSCAPKLPPDPYNSGWWISGQYVNVTTGAAGPTGCDGGDYISTAVGDYLEIDMLSKDGKWLQTIKDVQTNKTVDFTSDLKGQEQNDSMWLIETPGGERARPAEDTIWLQNVITFAQPVTTCQPDRKGAPDYFSAPTLSPDGLHCCWDKIVLKADRN